MASIGSIGTLPALNGLVKRHFITLAAVFLAQVWVASVTVAPLRCATLERLTLDDMISKSSAIVRGKVTDSWTAFTGSVIYTHYRIRASETYKGAGLNLREIVVTGGTVNGIRQNFSGSPTLNQGGEFVFFLWTSRAGLTQIIGLTQGLFAVPPDDSSTPALGPASDPIATRAPTRELMLDPATARPVKDAALSLRLSELRSRIAGTLAAGAH
jgi:hypothetical protein